MEETIICNLLNKVVSLEEEIQTIKEQLDEQKEIEIQLVDVVNKLCREVW